MFNSCLQALNLSLCLYSENWIPCFFVFVLSRCDFLVCNSHICNYNALLPNTIKAQSFTFTNSRCHHIWQISFLLAFSKSIGCWMLNFKCHCWICHSVFQAECRTTHLVADHHRDKVFVLSCESHPRRRSFHHCLKSLQCLEPNGAI